MVYESDVDSLEKRFKDGNTEYYLPNNLYQICIFSISTKVPDDIKLTQDIWDEYQKICVEARIHGKCWKDEFKGQVWAGDILNPILI